jgi:hypothetical protein
VRAGCAALNTEEDDEWVSGVRLSGSFGRREIFSTYVCIIIPYKVHAWFMLKVTSY